MSTDYSKMSDFEINLLVARIILNGNIILERQRTLTSSVFYENHQGIKTFDPCNSPADAWPIIADNGISLECIVVNRHEKTWRAQFKPAYVKHRMNHKNPLRAAMIVFLMMQESKNAS